ncbi:MAG TPA: hypothetical protein VNC41_11555 [Acidimicrobiia bacterium]|nr:hypothetical protein [Acidimicrobiia bacterium]
MPCTFDSISATAPETTAALCEVPLPRTKRSSGPAIGDVHEPFALMASEQSFAICASAWEPGTCRLMTCSPGAVMSTERSLDACCVKSEDVSSSCWFGPTVPLVS